MYSLCSREVNFFRLLWGLDVCLLDGTDLVINPLSNILMGAELICKGKHQLLATVTARNSNSYWLIVPKNNLRRSIGRQKELESAE